MCCRGTISAAFVLILLGSASAAHAQFAVIDVASVTQLIMQVQTLQQQLATARNHLVQAQAEFQSITGSRGMDQLLAGTVRNYLPPDWNGLASAVHGGGSYPVLATDVRNALDANAILTSQQLSTLSPSDSQQIQADRHSVAMLQAVAHEALAESGNRFASLQRLIDAIPRASDQKAVLDLQARIAAEQGMLANEVIKLQTLYESIEAARWANEQRAREQAIAAHGNFATRFHPTP
jgi:type IV secretion system protein VirB5